MIDTGQYPITLKDHIEVRLSWNLARPSTSDMHTPTALLQTISISTSLIGAGGIAALSLFSIPSFEALPASRSLPQIRWLFSRGSHIFPTVAFLSSTGFASLAFLALPAGRRSLPHLLKAFSGASFNQSIAGYVAAAALCISIAPYTSLRMIPTNFELIRMTEAKGGARSERSAREKDGAAAKSGDGEDPADVSVSGRGLPSQFSDLSRPQGKTEEDTTEDEDEKVRGLLRKFGRENMVRAVLLGAGGVVGLISALA